MNEMDTNKISLTEGVIDSLSFGDYWGECGDFGSRWLPGQTDKDRGVMRIYEMDADPGTDYGYLKTDPCAIRYCNDNFQYLNTVHDLLMEAMANWPEALPILSQKVEELFNQARNDERSVATNP
jgi:hypothetical protein